MSFLVCVSLLGSPAAMSAYSVQRSYQWLRVLSLSELALSPPVKSRVVFNSIPTEDCFSSVYTSWKMPAAAVTWAECFLCAVLHSCLCPFSDRQESKSCYGCSGGKGSTCRVHTILFCAPDLLLIPRSSNEGFSCSVFQAHNLKATLGAERRAKMYKKALCPCF